MAFYGMLPPEETFGSNLNKAFSEGLNQLGKFYLDRMLEQKQRNEMAQGLSAFMSPEKAQQAAMLPPEMLSRGFNIGDILKEQARLERTKQMAPRVAEFYRRMGRMGQTPEQMSYMPEETYQEPMYEPEMMEQTPQVGYIPTPQAAPLQRPSAMTPSALPESIRSLIAGGGVSPQIQQTLANMQPPTPAPQVKKPVARQPMPASPREQRIAKEVMPTQDEMSLIGDLLAEIAQEDPETAKELSAAMREQQRIDVARAVEEGRESRFKRKLSQTEILADDKRANKDYTETVNQAQAATEMIPAIEEMINLNNSGGLISTARHTFLKALNIDLPILLNPKSEQYKKTYLQFLTGMKNIFGSRVSNMEMQRFLDKLPTLANTKEGRALILNDMRWIAEQAAAKQEAIDTIIDEYNDHIGVPGGSHIPGNFKALMHKEWERRMAPMVNAMLRGEKAPMKYSAQPQLPQVGSTFKSRPPAEQVPNAVYEDDNGIKWLSNGYEWTQV